MIIGSHPNRQVPDWLKVILVIAAAILIGIVLALCFATLTEATVCTPEPTCDATHPTACATPTPMIQWDPVADPELLSDHRVYTREDGAPFALTATLPCEWFVQDVDGIYKSRVCRGADFAVPLQRHCPACVDFHLYEICVTARDLFDVESLACSESITICAPPIWQPGQPYN